MKNHAILVIGSATIDTIVQGKNRVQKMGGVAAYGGLTFSKHEIPTVVIANVAEEDTVIPGLFRKHGVRFIQGKSKSTTQFVNHLEGEFRWQELPQKASPIHADRFIREVSEIGHVHLGPLHPEDIDPEGLSFLSSGEFFVSLDIQGYVRHVNQGRVFPKVSKILQQTLKLSNVIKGSVHELELILEIYRMGLTDFQKTFDLDEIFITSGQKGGTLLTKTGCSIEYAAAKTERVLDPTGAGDVFFAAYLAARYHQNKPVETALHHASHVSAMQVEGRYIPFADLELKET